MGEVALLRHAHTPLSGRRHVNVTKEPLLFYATPVALHYRVTSSRPLTLPSDPGFLLTQMSDHGEKVGG